MTITAIGARKEYTGDAVTVNFSMPYKFFEDTDLKVYIDGVLKTLTSDYTVAGAGNDAGGTVTFLAAPASGTSVVVVKDIPATQEFAPSDGSALPASGIINAFDKCIALIQQGASDTGRVITIPTADPDSIDTVLPTAALRANKALIFDASGNVDVSTDDYDDQLADVTAQAVIATNAASAASASETNAADSETAAAASEAAAASSEANALGSATNAAASAIAAQAAEAGAETAEDNTQDIYDATYALLGDDPGVNFLARLNALDAVVSLTLGIIYGSIADAATDTLDYGSIADVATTFVDYGILY